MIGFIGLLTITLLALAVILHTPDTEEMKDERPSKLTGQLNQLWNISKDSIKGKRWLHAEKALLTILKFDTKNAAAYNRLGMLYAKQKDFKDAIECFEIAQSLDPSASNLHNVGLIYMETGELEKAGQALSQALQIDETSSIRHIAYAQVQEKLGNHKLMIDHLRRAVELEPSKQAMMLLADAYTRVGKEEIAENIERKIAKLQKRGLRTIKQPKKSSI